MRLPRWIASVASLSLLLACSSGPGRDATPEADTDESLDALVSQSCSVENDRATRYEGWLESGGTCEDLSTETGTWVARPLFEDAPSEVKDSTCRFTWRGRNHARPNTKAIEEAAPHLVATCARGVPPSIDVGEDDGVDHIHIMGGNVGCDVCHAFIVDGHGYVTRPDGERTRFSVQLADDHGRPVRTIYLAVPPSSGTPSATISLPPPPPGLHYVSGSPLLLRNP